MWSKIKAILNLYPSDYMIEVTKEIAGLFNTDKKREAAYKRRIYHYKAQYPLNRNDDSILHKEPSAMENLPKKQARRIYALYFLLENRRFSIQAFLPLCAAIAAKRRGSKHHDCLRTGQRGRQHGSHPRHDGMKSFYIHCAFNN